MNCTVILISTMHEVATHDILTGLIYPMTPGLGDFSPEAGIHCDINQRAIADNYILLLCTNAACMLLTIRYLIVRCIEKRSLFIVRLDSKSIFPFFFLASQIVGTAICSLKILYKDQQIIGKGFTMTFLGAFLTLFAQWGLVIYFFVVIKCLKSYTAMMTVERSERVSRRFYILSRFCLMIPPTSFIYSIMPLVGLPYPRHQQIFASIFLIGDGINAWLYGILTTLSLRCLLKELKSHVESFSDGSNDIRQVLQRLTYAYYVIASMSFIIGASYVMFGSLDYLLVRSTYLFIFQQLTLPPASTVLILTVSRISSHNSKFNHLPIKKMSNNCNKVSPVIPMEVFPPDSALISTDITVDGSV